MTRKTQVIPTPDALKIITDFSRDMGTIAELSVLGERILTGLSQLLQVARAALFLLDKEKDVYHLACSHGFAPDTAPPSSIPVHHQIPAFLSRHQSPVVRAGVDAEDRGGTLGPGVLATLESWRADVCVPLITKNRLIAFCLMGTGPDNDFATVDQADLLMALAQNAANALDNALLYEDLRRSQTLMRRTDRLRSLETIAGGFAHEIRNPLTSIKTFIQLAPERKDDPEFISEFSKVVIDDVHRIERLIQEILDYARYMEPKLTEEDLNEIVCSCLYFVEVKADSCGITIERELASDLPRVMLDRQQIKQVILNLLLNAMDAMSECGGSLTVRTHRLIKPSGEVWVQIEVEDTGPGIPESNLEHIFDPFFTTKHHSGEHEGTGLGLTIAHQIIQEHHGNIQVSSKEGVGTTFYVNMPAVPRPHAGHSSGDT